MAKQGEGIGGMKIGSYTDVDVNTKSEVVTVNTTTTITLPSWAKGFRLFPATNPIRFGVNTAPAATATLSAATLDVTTNFVAGAIAKNDVWEVRLLPPNVQSNSTSRKLYLLSTSSTNVQVEVF